MATDLPWKADFAQNPSSQGWQLRGLADPCFDGGWINVDGNPADRCLVIRRGCWQSPDIAVEPFHYYRLTFSAKTEADGWWNATFLDADGKEIAADVYDSVLASAAWESHTYCVRGHARATRVRLQFLANEKPLFVKNVAIEKADSADAAAWADVVMADCPPLHYTAPEERWQHLPHTMKTLRDGGTLRVVMLGDSICNDTSNSLFETLLERDYPKTRVEVVTSVRGSTGCAYYQEAGRVEQYVLRFKPDLVIIAGVSHGFDVEPIRSVIRQIRAESQSEILVLTGAICPVEHIATLYWKQSGQPLEKALKDVETFSVRMQRMAAEESVEFLDMRRAWERCLAGSTRPADWFHRDPIHGNSRGKQIVGRILVRYLEPQ